MSRATPKMRKFAERLVACETNGNDSATNVHVPFRVCEKMRASLGKLMGTSGFRALLSRALDLSDSEVPWLRTVRTKPDGSLDSLDEVSGELPAKQITEGGLVLVAQLLGLLVIFVGEGLTLSLLREVWPKLSLEALEVPEGDDNEKKK